MFYILLFSFTFIGLDFLYVKYQYKRLDGIIQTLEIGQHFDEILKCFVSMEEYFRMYQILQNVKKVTRFHEKLTLLTIFSSYITTHIPNARYKAIIKQSSKFFITDFYDYIWVHKFVYGTKEKNKFIDMACDTLIQCESILDRNFDFTKMQLLEPDIELHSI